ncbi:MAG TPA: methionyl-tRNA formyltransferase [Bacteroidaceae bacterium]|nr:methionyl-tRNA formyltransferase [Bacteroidaceae bacterium]
MKKSQLRIIFMGTPEFAEFSLNRIILKGYNVVAVVTMPDKPIGRHRSVLSKSPVKRLAISLGIPVLQPESLKDENFLSILKSYNAHLQIVVAFRMLPESVWGMPKFGTINLHASLLPQYRGAAPINWALVNGESVTGVTTFFIRHDIDTGDIISQRTVEIEPADNVATLHDKLMIEGALLLLETIEQIIKGQVNKTRQSDIITERDILLKPAPKIFKETRRIPWHNNMDSVCNFIRGFAPYPGAWSELCTSDQKNMEFKVLEVEKQESVVKHASGQIHTDGRKFLDVAVADGYIRLLTIQPAGKKQMSVVSFLCGNSITKDDFFK